MKMANITNLKLGDVAIFDKRLNWKLASDEELVERYVKGLFTEENLTYMYLSGQEYWPAGAFKASQIYRVYHLIKK